MSLIENEGAAREGDAFQYSVHSTPGRYSTATGQEPTPLTVAVP